MALSAQQLSKNLHDFEKFRSNLRVEEGSLLGVGAIQRHTGINPL
jgi:hypothetical protein